MNFLIVVSLWFSSAEPPTHVFFFLPPDTTQEECVAHVEPLLKTLSKEMLEAEKIFVACVKKDAGDDV